VVFMGAERQAAWIAHVPVGYIVRYLESGGFPDDDWRSSVSGILPHVFREAGGTDVWVAWKKSEVAGCVDFLATWTVRDMGDGLTSGPHTRAHGIHIASGMPICVRLVAIAEGRTGVRLITASLDWERYDDLRVQLVGLVRHLIELWPYSGLWLSDPLVDALPPTAVNKDGLTLDDSAELSLPECLAQGEGQYVEFKPAFLGGERRSERSRCLRSEVLETVASFLNTHGGTLLIGVENCGAVCGIAHDLSKLGNSQDRFQKELVDAIAERIGGEVASLIHIQFEQVEEKTVCAVRVLQGPGPSFLREDDGRRHFFVRFGNTTRRLDAEQATAYIQRHFQ